MSKTIYCFAITLLTLPAFSQNSKSVKLDSLKITMRDIPGHPNMKALSRTDSLYAEPLVQVSARMIITGSTNLKTVEIAFEKTQGAKDFKTYSLDYVADGAGGYLSYKGKRFPVVNSVVTISEQVPAVMAK